MASDETGTPTPETGWQTPAPEPAPHAPAAPPVPPGYGPATSAAPAPSAPSGDSPRDGGWRQGGIFFGGILVLVGLLALFGGVTSFFDVLRLWPLLIVFGGVMEMVSPKREVLVKRLAEGLGTIAFGVVLLGNSLGYIPWTVWFTLATLWPVLLVALGIELVGKGLHANWLRACSNLLLIVALGYGVFVLQPTSGRLVFPFTTASAATAAFAETRPHDPAVSTGTATIKVGATRLTIGAGDMLAGIAGRARPVETPKLSTSVAGSAASVRIGEPGDRTVFIGTEDTNLDVLLDRAVKWSEIRLDVGAIAGDADLSGLDVARVLLNVGASDVQLKIGQLAKDVAVEISGGATSVTVLVPADAACRIDSASGLSNVRVPASFRQTSGIVVIGNSTFESAGSGGPTITISLRSGVSDLRIDTY
jgi:hypothetical protein